MAGLRWAGVGVDEDSRRRTRRERPRPEFYFLGQANPLLWLWRATFVFCRRQGKNWLVDGYDG